MSSSKFVSRSRKTLDYLDRWTLGYASKRRARQSVARKFQGLEREQGDL